LARRDQFERDTTLAYQAVRIWVKSQHKRGLRMPKLESLLREGGPSQTVDEKRSVVQTLSQQYGIPLRKRGEGTFPKRKKKTR
jgi:hypothetical protein